jgi:hypothetical protein
LHGGESTHPECAALFDPPLSFRGKEGCKDVPNPLSAAGEERVVGRSNDRVSKYTSDINANARPRLPITLSAICISYFERFTLAANLRVLNIASFKVKGYFIFIICRIAVGIGAGLYLLRKEAPYGRFSSINWRQ